MSLEYLDQGADVVYHELYYSFHHDQKRFRKKSKSRQVKPPVFEDLIVNGSALVTSSVVVRKSVIDEIGGLCEDRNVVSWEDYDAWLRIAQVTDKFKWIPQCMAYSWRGGGNVLTAASLIENIDAWERKYLSRMALDQRANCVWADYRKGRCYYSLKDYNSATSYLFPLIFKRTPPLIKLKALLTVSSATARRYLS